MNCPACNYFMSDLDAECPRCRGKGVPGRVQAAPDPFGGAAQPPAAPSTASDSASDPWKVARTVFEAVGAVATIFLLWAFFANRPAVDNAIQEVARQRPVMRPEQPASPAISGRSPVEEQQAERTWLSWANRVMEPVLSPKKIDGESTYATLTRMEAIAESAQNQMLSMPPMPPRCSKAHSLMVSALGEVWLGVRAAKRAIDFNTQATVDEANQRRQRAGELIGLCADELQRLGREIG